MALTIKQGDTMITVENLSFSYADKSLYNDISFTLDENEHCAFIGPNGSGKSTLAHIIMNPDNYIFDGRITKEANMVIGFVSQFIDPNIEDEMTVYNYIAYNHIKQRDILISMEKEMEFSEDIDTLLLKYQEELDKYALIGGDDFEAEIDKKLSLSNLADHKDLKISKLSGGEFKLAQLIREMLSLPDLIVMDEPDAFLDFDNLGSLERIINTYKGTLLVITHNRYILNHCFNKVLHLEGESVVKFEGNYVAYNYEMLNRKIDEQELATIDHIEIERNRELVERLRDSATKDSDPKKGGILRSRKKMLERLENRKSKSPYVRVNMIKLNMKSKTSATESEILKVKEYSKSYSKKLFDKASFEIKPKEKVALIGGNGTGKTTLLRDIYKNEIESITVDAAIKIAYMSQIQGETLDDKNTVKEEFFTMGFNTVDSLLRYLEPFKFDKSILGKRISQLSGGEKNIIQLAKISYTKPDLLLLDEPTSHLDLYAQLSLEEALKGYDGTLIMISHDYYTIVNSMDYVLMVKDKKIEKISINEFKSMIHENHYNKKYLELEDKKRKIETEIALALEEGNYEFARELYEALDEIIKML